MANFDLIESLAYAGLNESIREAVELLITDIKRELQAQGHNLSGRLSRSLEQRIVDKAQEVVSEVDMFAYGRYQNEGIKPSRIPFGKPKSGTPGGKSKFIEALKQWVKDRGISSSDSIALRIAFAIAKKMKKEGMPTKGAKRFSSNGRRRGFVNVPFARGKARTENLIADGIEEMAGDMLQAVLVDLDREYENLFAI